MKTYLYLLILIVSAVTLMATSCSKETMTSYNDLKNLPADEGGTHEAFPLGTTEAFYGYYAYTPSVKGANYPLLLFLHGAGEKGNSNQDNTILDIVLRNGPPKLIEKNEWKPTYPMIVVSPQCHESNWNGIKLYEFVEYLIKNYNINTKRIYVTGLSMGGYGTFTYLTTNADSCHAATAVPICGGGNTRKTAGMKHVPVWAFHGDADKTVLPIKSIQMVDSINAQNPPIKAKLTMYPGVGHNSWSRTYAGTGMGTESAEYDAFNQSIFDWMFQYSKE